MAKALNDCVNASEHGVRSLKWKFYMALSNHTANIIAQLDNLIQKCENLLKASKRSDHADLNRADCAEVISSGLAAITRISGKDSQYEMSLQSILDKYSTYNPGFIIPHLLGTLKGIRGDVASGNLATLEELINASLFADFLEMASYFLDENYKDPAAVIIGSVLEEHLRKLCDKHGVTTTFVDGKGNTRPKKADSMNSDLVKAGTYSKLDQKNVTAWLDLRNKAAHGEYSEYTQQQVELLKQSVSDFISRHPA